MEEKAARNGPCLEAKDDLERFRAVCREEAGLDSVRLEEVRRRRCLEHFRERVRAISRLGVEARRKKAAERRAAQKAADLPRDESETTTTGEAGMVESR